MTLATKAPVQQERQSLRRLALRRGLLALVAILAAEAVWMIAVPPFRGSDEIDHVYRAAGVATGQVHLSQGAAHGRGLLVWVPTDIVDAAQRQCRSLKYDGRDNCFPVETSGDRSLVATSAGGYDPIFYAVVGTVARPFHGAAADYAMRAVTALLCALLLAAGVAVMTFAGTGRWVTLGLLTALTPEVMFGGAIPAPNGVEIGVAFVLWAALLAAVRQPSARLQRRLLAVAVVAAVPLMYTRMLGPLWVASILASVILLVGLRATRDLVLGNRAVVASGVVLVGIAGCWWAAWQHIASQVTGVSPDKDAERWILAFNLPVFTMQMVGAFPYRDLPAPLAIYPLVFLVVALLGVAAWKRGPSPRARRTVFWMVVFSLVVPVALSVLFMPSLGAVWQGRYELPYVIGILPLCGLLLDDVDFAPIEGHRLIALSSAFLVFAQVASVYHVQQIERLRPQSINDPAWWHPPGVVLGVLMLVACGIAGLLFGKPPPPVHERPGAAAALTSS
jgi:hypothetical protein